MRNPAYHLLLILIVLACNNPSGRDIDEPEISRARYEPSDGEVILFVGQELEAIGGLEDYNDGYLDHFEKPGGFTMYTNLSPDDTSFGYIQKGLDGIFSTDDWGDSPSNMSMQLADPDFDNLALAIGLSLVNHEGLVADGTHDSLVVALGTWIQSLGERPVFLRIGYEFSGMWNHYDREDYIAAYRRIKDTYDSMGIDNIAYVWQSHGWEEPVELLKNWYPGDDYVDWCAFSFFARWEEVNMIEFARRRGKPVFIAEATPTLGDVTIKTDGQTIPLDLSNPEHAQKAWDEWFIPFFKMVNENSDVIKAISYINCNWKSHRMWFDNPTFQYVDARLQLSEEISSKWIEETSRAKYLKASPELFSKLQGQ